MTEFHVPQLDRSRPLALYYQIAEILRGRIESGALEVGEAIPTEEELQRLFAVSRATVRQAVRELVTEGLLRLERPHGTFVTQRKLQENLPELISFSEEVRQQGRRPAAQVLATASVPASSYVARRLGIDEGAPTVRVDRLRLADDEPIALMYSHIAGWTGLTPAEDYTGSLHALLASQGIRLVDADQIIEAVTAAAGQARLLRYQRGSALLKVDRVTFSADGRAVEHVEALYRADRYTYRMRLSTATGGSGYIE